MGNRKGRAGISQVNLKIPSVKCPNLITFWTSKAELTTVYKVILKHESFIIVPEYVSQSYYHFLSYSLEIRPAWVNAQCSLPPLPLGSAGWTILQNPWILITVLPGKVWYTRNSAFGTHPGWKLNHWILHGVFIISRHFLKDHCKSICLVF